MRDIAIFGGSFDPPHLGHLEIIKTALEILEIEKLFIIPCFLNPFKKNFFFNPDKRISWLRKLLNDKDSRIEILDFEIKQKKPIHTIETIDFIQATYKPTKIYLLLGADNLETLPLWHGYQNLKNKVEFIIAPRHGFKITDSFKILPMQEVAISSTQIREGIKSNNEEIIKFIPLSILKEVKEKNCNTIENK
ncbi:MAG: nicotinate (nicotinamide) nucleotide adenylyltransferase [Helicobacter sp.]|nr:nicotinate (nicotinamide) nucleotide adenylyltransferase [Helicobacter sp.]